MNISIEQKTFLELEWERLEESFTIYNGTYNHLISLYSDPRRHYHNLNHIYNSLIELNKNQISHDISYNNIHIIKAAIWFHDCFYTCSPIHDENLSKEFFKNSTKNNHDTLQVLKLIDLTKYHLKDYSFEISVFEKTFLNIDMSIFKSEESVYQEYVDNIFKEYISFYPDSKMSELLVKRRGFLQTLLAKNKIFYSLFNNGKDEKIARNNINNELSEILKFTFV